MCTRYSYKCFHHSHWIVNLCIHRVWCVQCAYVKGHWWRVCLPFPKRCWNYGKSFQQIRNSVRKPDRKCKTWKDKVFWGNQNASVHMRWTVNLHKTSRINFTQIRTINCIRLEFELAQTSNEPTTFPAISSSSMRRELLSMFRFNLCAMFSIVLSCLVVLYSCCKGKQSKLMCLKLVFYLWCEIMHTNIMDWKWISGERCICLYCCWFGLLMAAAHTAHSRTVQ